MAPTHHSHELGNTCLPAFRVAQPHQYLVRTGAGTDDIRVSKKTWHWPFQRVSVVSLNPRNYTFQLNNMSAEMVPFALPVVFTIGPQDPKVDPEAFLTYCRTMLGLSEQEHDHVVAGVVHGQIRVYSATLTIRDMFENRDLFKHTVQDTIQKDLNQYGLFIYNANIAEMKDLDLQNKYFENLKQKALEGATTEARIQVAEARKLGDIGESQRAGETKMSVAGIQAEVIGTENLRAQDVEQSKLELQLVKTTCRQQEEVARVQADYVTKQKTVELQTNLEKLKALQQLEHLRAMELSAATVAAEAQIKAAEGEAEAVRRRADAELYLETKRAEALKLKRVAQAEGLKAIFEAAGNRPEVAMYYLSMENGLYDRMAEQTASAIKGMAPKLNIWHTGDEGAVPGGGGGSVMASIHQLFAGLPPMLEALQQQTNIRLPSWMPQCMPNDDEGQTTTSSQPMPGWPTTAEISALWDDWHAALQSSDPDRVADLYAPDAVLLPTVSNVVRTTHDGIHNYFADLLLLRPTCTVIESHIRLLGPELAARSGVFRMQLHRAEGTVDEVEARFSFVYRKLGRRWLIIEHHSSAQPTPAPAVSSAVSNSWAQPRSKQEPALSSAVSNNTAGISSGAGSRAGPKTQVSSASGIVPSAAAGGRAPRG